MSAMSIEARAIDRRIARAALLALVFPAIYSGAAPQNGVALTRLASRHGLAQPLASGGQVTLHNANGSLVFEVNSRKVLLDGVLIWMNVPLLRNKTDWELAHCDTTGTIAPLLRPDLVLTGKRVAVVMLDAGHGGSDTGAIGKHRMREASVTLDIAERTRGKLNAARLSVELTRSRDETVSLTERTAKAVKRGADLFVSIHVNSSRDPAVSGIETYVLPAQGQPSTANGNGSATPCPGNVHDRENAILAYGIHKALRATTGADDRGLRHARFEVLRAAPCPAALVECAFISNPVEESILSSAVGRDAVADGIARGILDYVGLANRAQP
jgi:N-acetylmuramoyl-L-alanine amidase